MSRFTEHTRLSVVRTYVLAFYVLALMKWLQGGWLYQYQPFIFRTRMDGFTWLFMQTGLHKYAIAHPAAPMALDLLFYSVPAIFLLVWLKRPGWIVPAAWLMLLVNWTYVQVYTLYPTNSIEAHIAWLLFPFLFMFRSLKGFYLAMQGLRYYFLFFFGSAGIWKLVDGGAFNSRQMSHILLYQHSSELVSSPGSRYTAFIYYLVRNSGLSYGLYLAAVVSQLSFLVGFLTRRLDRLFLLLFLAFLIMDHLLMKINYTDILPLAIPLWYSRYEMPED